jgi:CubicO group peptidase (beta-lactamase class C family)
MKKAAILILLVLPLLQSCNPAKDVQPVSEMYFPPAGPAWETTTPARLGWDESAIPALLQFLRDNNSRSFLVLRDGKIVIEAYMGKQFDGVTDFSSSSSWYWASAGKTLTSAAVGIASSQGFINPDAKTSTYLGAGWTSLSRAQEDQITVRHQLTMTTGLDDGVADRDCTDKTCLIYKAAPGTRWAYHNAPYTLLDKVISKATGKTLNTYLTQELKSGTGMDGQFVFNGSNNVYYSTARSMARFGLLMLNTGSWDGRQVVPEAYMRAMAESSQNLNPSYGLLTWLNGKSSFMVPTLQTVFEGPVSPGAPADMIAAMGKNGQLLNVVPGQGLVIIRMGDAPDNALVPFAFQQELWAALSRVIR